jgi:hypothetical protein
MLCPDVRRLCCCRPSPAESISVSLAAQVHTSLHGSTGRDGGPRPSVPLFGALGCRFTSSYLAHPDASRAAGPHACSCAALPPLESGDHC